MKAEYFYLLYFLSKFVLYLIHSGCKNKNVVNNKQFLLTNNKKHFPNLKEIQSIGDFSLYLGKDSEYCCVKNGDNEIHLLGVMYDWEMPSLSNAQILENISQNHTLDAIIDSTDRYCGHFVLIIKIGSQIFIVNDAAAQKEVYYDSEFTTFGSQPKLLGLAVNLIDHTDEDAIKFYDSELFKRECLFIGETTHKKNIYHLLPNHLLNISEKRRERFFPNEKLDKKANSDIVIKTVRMLRGYITAVSNRSDIKMGVTGGYDSRVLFLASLNVDCEYFISQQSFMDENYYELVIPRRLCEHFGEKLNFEIYEQYVVDMMNVDYLNDVDFPRFIKPIENDTKHLVYVNGNISEIARNYYGYFKRLSGSDLNFLTNNTVSKFVSKQYDKWLEAKVIFKKYGYHYLDMFYWEEKMGNWAAKGKTESFAFNKHIISPFNSRDLIKLLLSSERKHRDAYFNRLYDLIIYELSGRDEWITKLPVNPTAKKRIVKYMKTIRVFNLYRYIIFRLRKLKLKNFLFSHNS